MFKIVAVWIAVFVVFTVSNANASGPIAKQVFSAISNPGPDTPKFLLQIFRQSPGFSFKHGIAAFGLGTEVAVVTVMVYDDERGNIIWVEVFENLDEWQPQDQEIALTGRAEQKDMPTLKSKVRVILDEGGDGTVDAFGTVEGGTSRSAEEGEKLYEEVITTLLR